MIEAAEVQTVVNRALVAYLLQTMQNIDNALDVIERLLKHLNDLLGYPDGAEWLDCWCFGHDHELYDDILSLPAPTKKETT
jgi:hypothetical protein